MSRPANDINRKIRMQILSNEDCERIFNTAKEILFETGVDMRHDRARALFEKNGCRVEGNRVFFPPEVIDKALSMAPDKFTIYDREGKEAYAVGDGSALIGPMNTNAYIIDSRTRERRETVRKDAREVAWICHALPDIAWVAAVSAMADCNQDIACVYESYEMIQNTTKPITTWALDCDKFQYMVEMYQAVRGGKQELIDKPYVVLLNNPETPLSWGYDDAERMYMMVENGIIPSFGFESGMGSMAPATIAGTYVDILLAALVGLALAQFIRPGSPFIMGIAVDSVHFASGGVTDSGPERTLAASAVSDLSRYIGLPISTCGGCSDSPVFDQQAAFEMAMQIFNGVLSGIDYMGYAGFLEAHMGISFEAIAFCAEVRRYARKYILGITVDEDTMAKDVINEVGDGSLFLTSMHTMAHCRDLQESKFIKKEYFYDKYVENGKKDLNDRLNDWVLSILNQGNPAPIDDALKGKLDDIMRRAEKDHNVEPTV